MQYLLRYLTVKFDKLYRLRHMTSADFASRLQFFTSDCAQTKLSVNLKFGRNVVVVLFNWKLEYFFQKKLVFSFNSSSPGGAVLRLRQLGYSSCNAKWTVFCRSFINFYLKFEKSIKFATFCFLPHLKRCNICWDIWRWSWHVFNDSDIWHLLDLQAVYNFSTPVLLRLSFQWTWNSAGT